MIQASIQPKIYREMVWDRTAEACFLCHAGKEGSQMTKEKENGAANRRQAGNTKYRDSSGKIIFEDPVLCSQFLRGYTDISVLKDVKPEDIEDVTERYVHLFTEERTQM